MPQKAQPGQQYGHAGRESEMGASKSGRKILGIVTARTIKIKVYGGCRSFDTHRNRLTDPRR